MTAVRVLLLAALTAAVPSGAAAQSATRPVVKYGKWVVLAASIGMNILAADAHNDADRAFDQIGDRCAPPNVDLCALTPMGEYADPTTEALFQETLRQDTRAQRWLIAGEAALLGATALFVWELLQDDDAPPDIEPFVPVVKEFRDAVGLGLAVRF